MRRKRQNRISLSSTRLSIEPLENRALLAGVTADISLSNSLATDTTQVNTDAISSSTTGFPTNISVEAGDGQATVFWNSSDPQAFTYWVDISLDGGISWGTQAFYIPDNPTSGTVNKLINGVDYLLKARDPSNGVTSNTVSATPNSEIVLGAPQAPLNVIATVSNSSAFLDWEISTSEVLPILQYEITWQPLHQDLDRWTLSSSIRTNTAASIIDSLNYGDSYFCSVRLGNSIGWGHSSAPILITPGSGVITAPTAPRNLQAEVNNGDVTLSWDAPLSDDGVAITQYEISYRANTDSEWTLLYGTGTSATLPGFTTTGTYEFVVAAQNSAGWSPYSNLATVVIDAPTAPRNLQAEVNNGDVTLSWDAPLSDGGVAITQYEISYRANTDSEWTLLYGTGTSATLPGFTTTGTYEFVVAAQNSAGWSPYSNLATVVIDAPTAPRNLQAEVNNGDVTLSWDAPLSDGGVAITQYEISYRANTDSEWTLLYGTGTSATLPGFTTTGTYEFVVAAQNSAGWSPYSNLATVVIDAPTAPRNLQAEVNNGDVTLSWDAPLSDGGVAITQYEISYRANTDSEWTLLYGTGTSATLPGFINGVTYQFAVSAQNSVGWSEYSSIVTATPSIPINNSPSLNVLNDMLINEDSQGQTVGLTGITVGNDGNQSLRVTSVSSNTGLLPSPIVTYTSPNTTGSLTFTPVANQKGAATITVTVENGGLDDNLSTVGDNKTVQRSFQVTVLEVIASTSSVVLAKDSFQNLYVDTKPVTYNQQQVPQEFFGSTVIDAEMVDSQNFLLLKPLGNQGNQPTHRLLTDNTWRINGIFNALQNESSPILEISGREVSDTLNIATVSGAYEINGVNNPTLIVRRGQTYLFNLNTSGHPFYLQTTGAGYQSANIYIGFSGNGQTSGEHQWVVPEDAPDEIFYQCKFHSVMFGKIVVID